MREVRPPNLGVFPPDSQLGELGQSLKWWSSDLPAQDTFHITTWRCSAPESHFPQKICQSLVKIPPLDYGHVSKSFLQTKNSTRVETLSLQPIVILYICLGWYSISIH